MTVIFDFPLNEKVRAYLRIEQLILRCEQELAGEVPVTINFFYHLFDLMELLERSDLKQDLIKDLEAQSVELSKWAMYPGVNLQKVSDLQHTVNGCLQTVRAYAQHVVQLKQDKFLSSIRQRFAMPGGNCCFDLPQLHLWLNQSTESQREDCQRWFGHVEALKTTVTLLLQLMRNSKHFHQVIARNGFFQDSAEGVQLVRVRVAIGGGFYPTLSGSKHRFAIRFMSDYSGATSGAEQDIHFELATC